MNISDEHCTSTSDIEGKGAGIVPSWHGQCYEIRFKGHLDDHWVAWFHGCSMTREEDGTTTTIAPVVDQAELFGLLNKIRDLSLSLISVNKIEPDANMRHEKESREWNLATQTKTNQ